MDDSNKMSLHLAERSINSKDMVQNIVEENKWHVQFFFVENSEASFCVLMKLLAINRDSAWRSSWKRGSVDGGPHLS
jgi:hypothetical protein